MPTIGTPALPEHRQVRVFISSTFRDMHAERDVLIKHVFPKLRKLCDERGVTFVDVDLRWGITQEQAGDDRLLSLCLGEIDRCRPFFIGLLGERYGSVVRKVEPALLERLPWLRNTGGCSITEVEIAHGVLIAPQASAQSYFYFRSPQYAARLPAGADPRTFQPESPESAARVADLKGRIRRSGRPVREDYADASEMGRHVLADLEAAIDALFPEQARIDPLDRESMRQRSFQGRTPAYVSRPDYFKRLDAHGTADGGPLVIHGPSGSGKTSLLATWAEQRRRTHPQDLVLTHFVGATPDSVDAGSMLRRVAGELKRTLAIDRPLPGESDDLRSVLPQWLRLATAALAARARAGEPAGRLVLILDALDRLQGRDGIVDLTWLPNELPSGASLVVSSAPGPSLDELQRRGLTDVPIAPLTQAERSQVVNGYLAIFGKSLPSDLLARLISAPQSATPLYLRVLLDELKLHGQHETLAHSLDHYLGASDVGALYQRILARWEAEYERDRPGLVRDAMSLLWAARKGLSEHELLILLGTPGHPLPRAYWSGLFLAAEHGLIDRAGQLGFFHDSLRQAVEQRFLPDQSARKAAHLKVAIAFAAADVPVLDRRRLEELPWQLVKAEAWAQLARLLSDPYFLNPAWAADQQELFGYAARLAEEGRISVAGVYAKVIREPDQYDWKHVWTVSQILIRGHDVSGGCALQEHLIERLRAAGDFENLASALNNRALTLADAGENDRALALHAEQAAILRRLGDKDGELSLLVNQVRALEMRGEYAVALEQIAKAEQLCREARNSATLQRVLSMKANIARAQGDLQQARELYEEVEVLNRQTGDLAGLSGVLAALAEMAAVSGDPERASALIGEADQLARMSGDWICRVEVVSTQARIAWERGDLDQALKFYDEAEGILPGVADTHLLLPLLGNRAALMLSRGQHHEALEVFERVERLSRATDKLSLMQALTNQGAVWLELGSPERAVPLNQEAANLAHELRHYNGARTALNNLRIAAVRAGLARIALKALDDEMELCRANGDDAGYAELLAMKRTTGA